MIEAAFNIRIQHIFGCVADFIKDRSDSIVASPSWSKSVTVRFKAGFPFWFQSLLSECLTGSLIHHGNAKRALFQFARFGYPDPSDWFGFPLLLMFGVNSLSQGQPFWRGEG